jgi:hypothetical protein
MPSEIIYGIECFIPDIPENLEVGDNKFVRTVIPKILENVERDKDDRAIYNEAQLEFINQEIRRCEEGFWFMNNNVPTYLTGFYYYYLNYWTLENNVKPEYRDSDRRFFLFFDECYNDPEIIGILRGKHRRLGASSQGTCIGTKVATFDKNKNYGNVSMNDDYAEKLYQGMILVGFFNLPEFLRPRLDTSGTNKKKLHFIETPKRGDTQYRKIEGLNSVIDYMPTMLNSYDSTRLSFLLGDEWGKWEKVDITRYFEVVKECVKIGARKVGFVYCPTTVNPPTKGGDNFKKLWEGSNQFEVGKYNTSTGMVKYFQPAWDGLDGFVDELGYSVIQPPDEKTLEYLHNKQLLITKKSERVPYESLRKGAKKYLEDEFAKLKTDDQKSDFKRKYPFTEDDMWDFGNSYSPFNLDNIKERKQFLINNPVPLRRGKLKLQKESFVRNGDEVIDFNVEFEDSEAGNWLIYELPKKPNQFEIDWERKVVKPLNTLEYAGGCDPYRFDQVESLGSMGVICIGKKMDTTKDDKEEGGEICALYVGRPKLTELFYEEILKASLFFGCTITVESDVGDGHKKYFSNRMQNEMNLNCLPLLGRRPDAAIDPSINIKDIKKIADTPSGNPFIFVKQIELAQVYFEKYCHKIYFIQILEQAEQYIPNKGRTKHDILVGFMICLLNMNGQSKVKALDYGLKGLIKTYQIKPTLAY